MQGQYRWDIRWVSPAEPAFSCHAELVLNAALGGGDAAPCPFGAIGEVDQAEVEFARPR
jgi:hypothetical protein